MSEGCGWRGIW